MASPDLLQNAKDLSDWRHQVSNNLMQDEDNGDGDTASEAFVCGICSKSLKIKNHFGNTKRLTPLSQVPVMFVIKNTIRKVS